jgi:hypothetical protein
MISTADGIFILEIEVNNSYTIDGMIGEIS